MTVVAGVAQRFPGPPKRGTREGGSAADAGLKACATFLSIIFGAVLAQQAPPRFDIILRHGTVVDGTGLPRYRADVGITGRHIAKVGDLSAERSTTDIDVTGLFVAPGFINIHSHASLGALPTAENMLTQGVTSEIVT